VQIASDGNHGKTSGNQSDTDAFIPALIDEMPLSCVKALQGAATLLLMMLAFSLAAVSIRSASEVLKGVSS
jgi:hypothetical protein